MLRNDAVGSSPTLNCAPGTCALGIHVVFEWAGGPYDDQRLSHADLRKPDHLALNRSAVVPSLIQNKVFLTEAFATLLVLARTFPVRGPHPDLGPKGYLRFGRLIISLGSTLHPYFWPWFVPERCRAGTEADQSRVEGAAEPLTQKALGCLDAELDEAPFFMGRKPTALGAYAFPMLRWGDGLDTPAPDHANLNAPIKRLANDHGGARAMAA